MNNEKKFMIQVLTTMLVMAVLIITGSFVLISMQINNQTDETKKYLYEVAVQSKNTIETQISGDFQSLKGMAGFIGNEAEIDINKLLDILDEENRNNIFLRMGFIYPDGKSYIVDISGERYIGEDFSDREYVQRALRGEAYLSEKIQDRLGAGYVNNYSVPVYHNGKVVGVLIATMKSSILQKLVETPTFNDSGFSHIISMDGNYIVRSGHRNANPNIENIFTLNISSKYDKESIMEDMKQRKSGIFSFEDGGGERWATYVPLSHNNWYILSVVPKNAVNQNFNHMITYSVIAVIVISIAYMILYFRIRIKENENKKQMRQLAYFDKLTGCFNKNMFHEVAFRLLEEKQSNYAVVVVDINNFKYINEMYGFAEGNLLLKHVAKVCSDHIKSDEIFARFVADKFLLMIKYMGKEKLIQRLETIMNLISQYSIGNNRSYSIVSNAGINIIHKRDKVEDIDLVIDHANVAVNKIKGRHFNSWNIYDDELHKKEVSDKELENDMESALKKEEFVVYLQPKFLLKTETIVGAEALVRWNSQSRGMIPPDSFIPLFERNGFVLELDMYVLDKVCETLHTWMELGYTTVPISVNQSRLHLYEADYVEKLLKILDKYKIHPNQIILEVTESVAFNNTKDLKKMIMQLQKLGFSISMDDFGSGYSSLNVLKELSIDELKLDKIFLEESEDRERREAIITKIIELSKSLKIETVTEGVETKLQAEFLKSVGCDIAQGYYYAKPMPIMEFRERAYGEVV